MMLTKSEALELIDQGEKVTHKFFTPYEFIAKSDDPEYYQDENGLLLISDFWDHRQHSEWQTGWSVFTPIN